MSCTAQVLSVLISAEQDAFRTKALAMNTNGMSQDVIDDAEIRCQNYGSLIDLVVASFTGVSAGDLPDYGDTGIIGAILSDSTIDDLIAQFLGEEDGHVVVGGDVEPESAPRPGDAGDSSD